MLTAQSKLRYSLRYSLEASCVDSLVVFSLVLASLTETDGGAPILWEYFLAAITSFRKANPAASLHIAWVFCQEFYE